MKNKKAKLVSLIILGSALNCLQAQETTAVSGGNASGSNGSSSYTVGQVVYTTNSGTSGSVSQGVQQPFEILVVTGIETLEITLQCAAFPNPTTDFLYLKVDASTKLNIQSMSYQLFDIQGRLIETKKIDGDISAISMKSLPPENYILKVISGEKAIKSFKIIKN